MNIQLTEESRRFVASQVTSGRYASEDEVVEAALRRMQGHEVAPQPGGPLDDDPWWGLFRDEPEMIDQITHDAMQDRRAVLCA